MSAKRFLAAVAGLVIPASAALAQPPATPSPAPAGAPAGASNPLIDAKAKAALTEAASALKAAKGLRVMVAAGIEGAPVKMGGEGKMTVLRSGSAGSPGGASMAYNGTIDAMDGARSYNVAMIEGKLLAYQDSDAKRVVETPFVANSKPVQLWLSRPQSYMQPPFLQEGEPFLQEFRAREIRLEEDREVRGEMCTVVRCVIEPNNSERIIAISKSDKLPRRYEQTRIDGKARRTRYWEFWSWELNPPVTAKELHILPPPGYTLVKEEGAPAPTNPATPQKNPAPTTPPGGPQKGADAPGFTLPKVDGSGNLSLGALRGKVVVVGFWGPLFDTSKVTGQVLAQATTQYAGKNVHVVGIACRETDPARVAKYLADNNLKFESLTGGDTTAGLYNVRGFPSVCIIDAEGKVADFIEGPVTSEALAARVDAVVSRKQ